MRVRAWKKNIMDVSSNYKHTMCVYVYALLYIFAIALIMCACPFPRIFYSFVASAFGVHFGISETKFLSATTFTHGTLNFITRLWGLLVMCAPIFLSSSSSFFFFFFQYHFSWMQVRLALKVAMSYLQIWRHVPCISCTGRYICVYYYLYYIHMHWRKFKSLSSLSAYAVVSEHIT